VNDIAAGVYFLSSPHVSGLQILLPVVIFGSSQRLFLSGAGIGQLEVMLPVSAI
jgi:hypothetical protein